MACRYLIPSAFISTDIAVAMPLDGGYVAWIDEAFGSIVGAQNMYWCAMCRAVPDCRLARRTWINNVLTAAIYPVLAGHYIVAALGSEVIPRELLSEAMVGAVV